MDSTAEVVRPFLKDQRVRYFPSDALGLARSKNLSWQLARADLLAFLDADDIWLPTKLERQLALFRTDPALGVVFTRRELLNALKNFDAMDKNKDGVIERTELAAQFRITASQGQSNGQFRNVVFNPYNQTMPRTAATKGPLWFRKMDRNGDGDVSEREFLGTPEEFKEIDTDHDGLISVQEAEKYDALRKARTVSTK